MTFKQIFCTLLFSVFALTLVQAQARLKRANRYMDNLDYMSAINEYNKILEKDDVAEAKVRLAECYRKIGDMENAEYWYGQVVRSPDAEPVHKLYYGQALQRNGKCDLAREWFEAYVEDVPDDLRGQYLVKACDYEEELMVKNAEAYEVTHMEFNSNLDDMSPVYHDGFLIFASERDKGGMVKRKSSWTGQPFLELYKLSAKEKEGEECGNFEYGKPEKFSKELNTKYHEAAATFSSDGKTIFFTRNNFFEGKDGKDDEGVVRLKVYSATSNGDDGWGNFDGLPFNSDEYSVAHPTLTPDESKLFFSSDMPGGFGGMDLYYSEKEGGRWGPPTNLGPSINTEGNEVFPYYHQTGRLYFASDGQIGLGGLDIYFMDDKGEGEWSPIENMGYPINTISDDFGVVFNQEGTCGHFSSDREGGTGRDDIYAFKKIASPVEVFVYNKETSEPIEGASVVVDCTGKTMTTGTDGKIRLDMKMNQCCNFTASADGFLENAKEGCTKNIPVGTKVMVEIPLERELAFRMEGVVFDQNTGMPIDGASVTLTSDCGDEQTFTTNDTGMFEFDLQKECCYKVKGSATGYIAETVRDQCTRGLETSTTLQLNFNLLPITQQNTETIVSNNNNTGNDDPDEAGKAPDYNYEDPTDFEEPDGDGVAKSGTEKEPTFPVGPITQGEGEPVTYLLHIYYDFNQSYIRDDAETALNELLEMLEDNPTLIVEIGSHTDSRGNYAYNRRLSQRRAESVVRWLVGRGIDRQRLAAVGYGESRNVNKCKNNIPCSEKEHQMNRRTEFRILGSLEDGYSVKVISTPNQNVRVSACQGCPF
ncbi:MAG: OmpA family protein [Bacteroidota bacterium]